MKIITFEKKEMIPLTYKENESYVHGKRLSHMEKRIYFWYW